MGATAAATVVVGAIGSIFSAGAKYLGQESKQKTAEIRYDEANRQAQVAREREARDSRIEQERIDYEANLAAERAEWEIGISGEKAEFTRARITEELALVTAAQKVGYAASGIGIGEGSPLRVMARTASTAETERAAVLRGHDIFAKARTMEAEEVKKGGELTYQWFSERLHAETGYEVASRSAEAAGYRSQAKYAEYGKYLSAGATLLGGTASILSELNSTHRSPPVAV